MNDERFHLFFQNSLDAIVIADDQGRYIDVNQAACDLFGYSREEMLRMSVGDLVTRNSVSAAEQYQNYLHTGQESGEFTFLRADHQERIVSYSACRLALGQYLSILRDITPQKQRDESLRREKSFTEMALASLPGIFYVIDSEGCFLRWNQNFERVSGYSGDEIAKLHPLDFFLDDDKTLIAQRIQDVFVKGAATAEAEFVAKDGTKTPYFFTGRLTNLEGKASLVGMGIDISERTRLDAKLREETESLETVNRIGQVLSAELDVHKLVQACTDAATELTGAQFGAFFYNVTNENGESYMLYTISGVPREHFSKFPMPRNTEIFAPTFAGAGTIRYDDVTKEPHYGRNAPYHGKPPGHLPVVSYLAVPVVSRSGEVLGGLFFGHEKAGVFSERAARIVEGIAPQAAIAIDNARLYEAAQREIALRTRTETALRQSEERYRQLTEAMPQLAWITGADGVPEYFNQGWYRYTGTTAQQMLGNHPPSFVHPHDRDHTMREWNHAVDTGEPYGVEYRLRGADGLYRWFLARGVPLKDESGQIVRWFGTCTDIEAQKRTVETERFLAGSSAALTSSLDYETTLTTVAQMAVPHLADWCSVYVIEADGNVRQLTIAHSDPDKVAWAQQLQTRYRYDPDAEHGVPRVLRTGQSEFYSAISDEMLVASAIDEEHLRILRLLGLTSAMVVPMAARGRTLGAISFVSAESSRPYTAADLAVAEDLALSAALAIENARLYQAANERSEQLSLAISEVHHRIKNNLQSVAALLEMQIPDEGDVVPLEAVYDSLSQIKTIALVHDMLARDKPIGMVDVAQVLTKLAQLLSVNMGAGAQCLSIRVDAEPIQMATKTATALALAVNELLTNAAKHNDASVQNNVVIQLSKEGNEVSLIVEDEGPGLPPGFDPELHASIGLNLIQTLIQHELRGKVRFLNRSLLTGMEAQRGTRVEIVFPVHSLEE